MPKLATLVRRRETEVNFALSLSLVLVTIVILIESFALRYLVRGVAALGELKQRTMLLLREESKVVGRPLPLLDLKRLDADERIDLQGMQGQAFGLIFFKPTEIARMSKQLIVAQLRGISRRAGGRLGVVCVGQPRHCRILSARLARTEGNDLVVFFANTESEDCYKELGLMRTPVALTVRPSGLVGHVGALESLTLQEHGRQ